jgi:DNA-binding SARP family transcriptional activator
MVIVHTLGNAAIDAGDTRITPTSVRRFALLLYLAAEAGRRASRVALRDLIFPEQTEQNARHSLREMAYQLRQQGVPIDSRRDGVALGSEVVRTDYVELVGRDRLTLQDLKAAEGGFLPGYAPSHSEAFSEWLEAYRARTMFSVCKALIRQVHRSRKVGDWGVVEHAARACLALDPMNEEGTLALAEMLAIGGAKTQALRLLDEYTTELGEGASEVRLPAALLKRRITERLAQPSQPRGSSPFVGREREMLELSTHLMQAKGERTQCVVIFGEPGIGKTRLVREFCTVAQLDGAITASTAMQPNDVHRSFGAFADLLPRLLSMPGALGCAPESLRSLDRLTSIPASDTLVVSDAGESEALCSSITHAILDLIDAITSEQLVVLAVENVQWADDASSRVLASLARTGRVRRLLVLLTARKLNGVDSALARTDSLSTIHLQRLAAEAIGSMTMSLAEVGDVTLDSDLRNWFEGTSEGNPLFLETLFAHYINTKERFAVPQTLTALLERRVELLSREGATVLRICAFLGKHSTLETVCRATDLPRYLLMQAVGELEESGLIKVDGGFVQPSHALLAEAVRRKTGTVETRLAHRCAAEALESVPVKEQQTAQLWDCADHWILAYDSERALRAISTCARYAADLGRPRDAANALVRALDLSLSRDDCVNLASQVVLAADAAGESELVYKGLGALRGHGISDAHDELEFAEFRARARAFQDAPIEQERLLRCAAAPEATPTHRVDAAMWILKHADIHGQLELAKQAIAAIPESILCSAENKSRLEFNMVRACILGSWGDAGKAARDLLEVANAEPRSVRTFTRLNAAVGLWRSGLSSDAVEAATAAYFDAQASGTLRAGMTVASILADINLELCQDQAVGLWIERAVASIEDAPELADHFQLSAMRVAASITIGDTDRARLLFDELQSRGIFDGSRMRDRWKKAFSLRLSQLETGAPVPEAEIQRVSRDVDCAMPMSGILDFEVATMCDGLLRTARYAEARDLRDRFLNATLRTRAVPPRALRAVSEAIDLAFERAAVLASA